MQTNKHTEPEADKCYLPAHSTFISLIKRLVSHLYDQKPLTVKGDTHWTTAAHELNPNKTPDLQSSLVKDRKDNQVHLYSMNLSHLSHQELLFTGDQS